MDINDNAQTMVNKRDLAIQVQLEKISKNAMKDFKYKGPLKMKSAVTNEMIEKYQDELQNTFYTDEKGIKRRFYVPASVDVQLEEPDDTMLKPVLTKQEIEDIRNRRQVLAEEIAQIEDALMNIPLIELDLLDVTGTRGQREKTIEENNDRRAEYEIKIQLRDNDIIQFHDAITDKQAEYNNLGNVLNINEPNRSENEAYLDLIKKSNQAQLKIQSDEINRLNRGRLNLEMQPNETPEQFKQRMLEVGNATFDDDLVERQAELRTYNKLKQNLKDIVRDEIFIDSFLKSITPN